MAVVVHAGVHAADEAKLVRDLAEEMKRKPFQLIADLMALNVFANINQSIEEPVAREICAKHGFRFRLERRERGAGLVKTSTMKKVVLDADDPTRIVGVLDWEMATLGDPLMDLGSTLGYWVEKGDPDFLRAGRLMPTDAQGAPTREEIVQRYSERTGYSMEHMDFYFCFGLFRLAVIAQQIYYRYYHGQTADKRFADCIHWVHGLERMCKELMDGSSL